MIDLYCERTDSGVWSEPINALSNLAFILVAIILFFQAKRHKTLAIDTGLLIAILFCIGVGSGVFHLFATRTALLADVLPILFFQIGFLIVYGRRVIGISGRGCFRLCMLFVLVSVFVSYVPSGWSNGTVRYAPAFLFLLGFGVYHYLTKQPYPALLLMAAGAFLLSMSFRSIDMYMCESFEIGTHFLWHILNATVLYMSLYVIVNRKS